MHLVLLGDSTLDNAAYTAGGPDVADVLRDLLPDGDRVTLLALDGATTHDVPDQVDRVPDDATHVVLSVGGNDAMLDIGVLSQPAGSTSEALLQLAEAAGRFEEAYRSCLRRVLALDLPTTVCTIYQGDFGAGSQEQTVVSAALTIWNDAIGQAAFDEGLAVVDLRRVCDEPSDYTRQIEPNEQGGRKIAQALHDAVALRDAVTGPASPPSYVVPSGS
jgi:hypothetical protein